MTFEQILILTITSAGGIGAVIWLTIKATSKYLADNLSKRYQLELDKKLEEYKSELDKKAEEHKSELSKRLEEYKAELDLKKAASQSTLDNKTYITKAKFDVEFEIYKNLSKLFFKATQLVVILCPEGDYYGSPTRTEEMWTQSLLEAMEAIAKAQDCLFESVPFISKELFEMYSALLEACSKQATTCYVQSKKGEDKIEENDVFCNVSGYINRYLIVVNEYLRDYLSTLDVYPE